MASSIEKKPPNLAGLCMSIVKKRRKANYCYLAEILETLFQENLLSIPISQTFAVKMYLTPCIRRYRNNHISFSSNLANKLVKV